MMINDRSWLMSALKAKVSAGASAMVSTFILLELFVVIPVSKVATFFQGYLTSQ